MGLAMRRYKGSSPARATPKPSGGTVSTSIDHGLRIDLPPTAEDLAFAREIYERYKAKPGSDHIASCDALTYLSVCMREFCPLTVLACGADVGTVTDALPGHECPADGVIATEHNEFCLNALGINVPHHDPSRLNLIAPDRLPLLRADVDMIVGDDDRGRYDVFRMAQEGRIVFAEGNRATFRAELCCSLS
jgi:hypothetical protein